MTGETDGWTLGIVEEPFQELDYVEKWNVIKNGIVGPGGIKTTGFSMNIIDFVSLNPFETGRKRLK